MASNLGLQHDDARRLFAHMVLVPDPARHRILAHAVDVHGGGAGIPVS